MSAAGVAFDVSSMGNRRISYLQALQNFEPDPHVGKSRAATVSVH